MKKTGEKGKGENRGGDREGRGQEAGRIQKGEDDHPPGSFQPGGEKEKRE